VFISDPELFNVMHVDTKYVLDGGVVEQGDVLLELNSEGPGFSTIECCVRARKMRHFDNVLALQQKKVPSVAVCTFAWCRWVLMLLMSFRS
jgi:phosphoribosylaminoimidazole (AIR) synthetase